MNIRHGDLALIGVDRLPEGLVASKTNVLMTGSGGNDHVVKGGTVYLRNDNPAVAFGGQALIDLGAKGIPSGDINHVGYCVARADCRLEHLDHGVRMKNSSLRLVGLDEGVYALIGQNEDTHQGFRPVID